MRQRREITLFESLMIAILLTLILYFASDRIFFANFIKNINKIIQTASKNSKEIKFTFVDLPEETPVKENPNAKLYSDISRKASGGRGKKSNTPYSKGNTPEVIIKKGMVVKSRRMKSLPQPQQLLKKTIKEKGKNLKQKKNTEGQSTAEALQGQNEKQKMAKVMKKKPYLNTENLFSATKPEVYSNENGGLTIPGNFSIDTQGFDLGPYAKLIQQKVKSNWIIPPVVRDLFLKGVVKVEFDIKKNGEIENLQFVKKTGIDPLDMAAFLAIKYSNPFPPLPSFIKKDRIHVKWTFYYYVKMK
ncbi:hypothetical protein TTHT_1818 [Thermotomaculum hydrothermale]|uniref:TonB C-terminal domain-containing protein n=1 Tax=Thermotomaculum hydrothermale TaxID=981385 RepID=A0A7R6PNE6_9BACT|nr:TonB family protein [Thermotomaculum hydrothermale]BBB33277.1 hypothetical protein TTHT_1818 [Thermotomaculum hydrothermale]